MLIGNDAFLLTPLEYIDNSTPQLEFFPFHLDVFFYADFSQKEVHSDFKKKILNCSKIMSRLCIQMLYMHA